VTTQLKADQRCPELATAGHQPQQSKYASINSVLLTIIILAVSLSYKYKLASSKEGRKLHAGPVKPMSC